MGEFKDYYKILGVDRYASDEEIKKAYRKLAKAYHPDLHPGEDQAKYEQKFKEVGEAYDYLGSKKGDNSKRIKYDNDWDAYYARKKRAEEARQARSKQESSGRNNAETNSSNTYYNRTRYDEQSSVSSDKAWDKIKQAWQEVREDEKKDPFFARHARVDKVIKNKDRKARQTTATYRDRYGNVYTKDRVKPRTNPEEVIFQFKRGTLHVVFEFITQLEKLSHITEDSVPKFIMRNRKTLAGVLTAFIIMGGIGATASDNNQQPTYSATTTITSEDTDYGTGNNEETSQVTEDYTVYRTYQVDYGDTLSELAEDANCTVSEIQRLNDITNKSVIQAGANIIIPYHIEQEDLEYATTSAYYTPGTSLEDFANQYSTTVDSIVKLNEEAIEDGQVMSDSLIVPNFNTPSEIKAQKEMANKTYTNNRN